MDNTFDQLVKYGGCESEYIAKKYNLDEIEDKLQEVLNLKKKYEGSGVLLKLKRVDEPPYHGLEQMENATLEIQKKLNKEISYSKYAQKNNLACISNNLREIVPNNTAIQEVISALKSNDKGKFVNSLKFFSCPPSKRTKIENKIKLTSLFNTDEHGKPLVKTKVKELKSFVDGSLDRLGMPVGISYCSNAVVTEADQDSDHCGPHASLIIGRRRSVKTGHCQYLVRNSWGNSSAAEYKKGIDVDGPNYWVNDDEIFSATMYASKIEKN